MYQLNIPKKQMTMIQVWVSIVLVVIALVMSFMPIITLKTVDNADQIEELMSDLDINVKIPEQVNVSAVSLIKGGKMIADIISIASDDTPDQKKVDAFEEKLTSKDGQNTVMTAVAVVATVVDAVGDDDGSSSSSGSNALSVIFEVMIIIMALLGVLALTLILPILFIIKTIKALVAGLTNLKTPGEAVSKVSDTLFGSLTLVFLLMLLQTLLPGMKYGFGLVGIVVVAICSAVMNTIVSRLYSYNKNQFMYINLLQGASIVGAVGFFVFFFNLVKSNIFSRFLNGTYTTYLTDVADQQILAEKMKIDPEINSMFWVDGIAIIALFVLVIVTIGYLTSNIARFSCSLKGGDSCLGTAIVATIAAGVASFLVNAKHGYYIILKSKDAEGDFSFLENMTKAELGAVKVAMTGAIIMLVVEIALMVLKKVLCKGMTKDEMKMVASGNMASAEAEAEAPVAEEASAAEAEVPAAEAEAAAAEEDPTAEEESAEVK